MAGLAAVGVGLLASRRDPQVILDTIGDGVLVRLAQVVTLDAGKHEAARRGLNRREDPADSYTSPNREVLVGSLRLNSKLRRRPRPPRAGGLPGQNQLSVARLHLHDPRGGGRGHGLREGGGGGKHMQAAQQQRESWEETREAAAAGLAVTPRRGRSATYTSALGARRSALGARRSALGARRSALGARRSALGAPLGWCSIMFSLSTPRGGSAAQNRPASRRAGRHATVASHERNGRRLETLPQAYLQF